MLITALCLDYGRRQSLMERGEMSRRTDTEYRYYNFKMYDAAAEIVGERYAEQYIFEIGGAIGYAKSRIEGVSEAAYKQHKLLIKDNIAKKLHLKD